MGVGQKNVNVEPKKEQNHISCLRSAEQKSAPTEKKKLGTPRPGIEPGASAWQAEMLPTTPTRTFFWRYDRNIAFVVVRWAEHGRHTTQNHKPHHSVIPRWIYRIPSELRSQAPLGLISTAVGDHAGILGAECFFTLRNFFFLHQFFWSAYNSKPQVPSFGHTTVDIPHPVRTAKSSTLGPNQYCGGGPRGNLGCRMFFCFLSQISNMPVVILGPGFPLFTVSVPFFGTFFGPKPCVTMLW